MLQIEYSHFRFEFDKPTLMRFGSPHFSRREASRELCDLLRAQPPKLVDSGPITMTRDQILCANEAFPEAAIASPLEDLEVWDEWGTGRRRFPYPGKYSRLGLSEQQEKIKSTTSMGVLGEVLAGVFGQAVIAPTVLVRVIRRWPDFIYATPDGCYAFLESKAFTVGEEPTTLFGLGHIPDELLGDGLYDALQQCNCDPYVRVWLAFTALHSVQPLRLSFTFLELDAPDRRAEAGQSAESLPAAVIDGLAQRAIEAAGASSLVRQELYDSQDHADAYLVPDSGQSRRKKFRARLTDIRKTIGLAARDEIESLLAGVVRRIAPNQRPYIEKAIDNKVKSLRMPSEFGGRRLEEAKQASQRGRLARIRTLQNGDCIVIGDVPGSSQARYETTWQSNWRSAAKPWGHVQRIDLWRCSEVVFAIGPEQLVGEAVPIFAPAGV